MPKGNATQRCAGTGRTFKVDGGIIPGGVKNVWTEYNDRFGFEIFYSFRRKVESKAWNRRLCPAQELPILRKSPRAIRKNLRFGDRYAGLARTKGANEDIS